jgi:hypothetical protein
MLPRTVIAFIFLCAPLLSYGCINDIECGYGNKCVKPEGSANINGICITPTDQFGNRDYSAGDTPPSSEPHEVDGCMFDTDCNIGFTCMKKSGELKGICIR